MKKNFYPNGHGMMSNDYNVSRDLATLGKSGGKGSPASLGNHIEGSKKALQW